MKYVGAPTFAHENCRDGSKHNGTIPVNAHLTLDVQARTTLMRWAMCGAEIAGGTDIGPLESRRDAERGECLAVRGGKRLPVRRERRIVRNGRRRLAARGRLAVSAILCFVPSIVRMTGSFSSSTYFARKAMVLKLASRSRTCPPTGVVRAASSPRTNSTAPKRRKPNAPLH